MLQRAEKSRAKLPGWAISLFIVIFISLVVREGLAAGNSDTTAPSNPKTPARGPVAGDISANSGGGDAIVADSVKGERGSSSSDLNSDSDEDASRKLRGIANRFAKPDGNGQLGSDARQPAKNFDAAGDQGGLVQEPQRSAPVGRAASNQGLVTGSDAKKANQQRLVDQAVSNKPLGPRGQSSGVGGALLPSRISSGESGDGMSALDLIAALGLVIGLIFAGRAIVRRMVPGGSVGTSNPAVQVLSRTTVAPRNHVLLLRVGGRVLIVGDSSAGLRTLGEMDDPDEVADLLSQVSSAKPGSVTSGFKQMLQSFSGAYGRGESENVLSDDGDGGQTLDVPGDDEFHIDRARDRVSGLLGRLRNVTRRGAKGNDNQSDVPSQGGDS